LRPLSILLVFILISIPAILKAQPDREANHCAVQKSPYKVSMDSGKVIYSNKCISCHQANGLGLEGVNPPLNGKLITGNKNKLIEILISSKENDGNASQGPMHGNAKMKDQEIAYVLTFIRNSFGNKASSVKLSEVKSVRKTM
jgi:mono/diheme cytochrome c family protein